MLEYAREYLPGNPGLELLIQKLRSSTQPMPNSSLPSSRANVRPCNQLKVVSLRYRGRQCEHHNSFLCFPSKKLTAKIYHIRLTRQFMRTRIQEIFTNESNTKASIKIPENQLMDNFYLMASFIQYNFTVLFLDIPVPVRFVKSQTP